MRKLASLVLIIIVIFSNCKKGNDGPVEVKPLAPSDLAVIATSSSQINLSWTDNSTNETGFKIERKLPGGIFQLIGTANSNSSSYSDRNNVQAGSIYRVYAFNSAGNSLGYSNEVTIGYPTITTVSPNRIKGFIAWSGGNFSSDGGAPVTAKGIVWSTSPNPTIDLATKTVNGTGNTEFSSFLSGLSLNKTYYIRAYATNVFGTSYGNEVTLKTDLTFTAAGTSGSSGTTPYNFTFPSGICLDNQGNVYISDAGNSRVQKWVIGASEGTTLSWGIAGGQGIFIDSNNDIFIAAGTVDIIYKFTNGVGTVVAGGNGQGSGANQFRTVTDVHVDKNGNLYMADFYNHRIQKWAPGATSGVTVAGGNGQGSGSHQFDKPSSIFVDNDGNMYISDFGNRRVQMWAPGATSGVTVAGGNGQGSAANQLDGPKGIFVDSNGNIYITDSSNQRIQKWAKGAISGTTVAGGNGPGKAMNQLGGPSDIFVDKAGNIFIADSGNHRIQVWGQ